MQWSVNGGRKVPTWGSSLQFELVSHGKRVMADQTVRGGTYIREKQNCRYCSQYCNQRRRECSALLSDAMQRMEATAGYTVLG